MKAGISALVGIVVVLVVVAGAWMWVQDDGYDDTEDVVPAAGIVEEGQDEGNAPAGQFVQEAPEGAAPLGLEGQAEGEAAVSGLNPDLEVGDEEGEAVTVEITDTGFVPEMVTIPVNTTVVFVNNGQAEHWPASDNHPTHEILPEFDAERGLATGESYSYMFEEPGEWGMHDHLFPQFTGTIVVE